MKKNCFCSFSLAGVELTQLGLEIPSPFCALVLNNSETDSYTSWELTVTVGGDSARGVNVATFESLIYSASQTSGYAKASGIPVSFMFGWLDNAGNIETHLSYQGWTLKYSVKTSGQYMSYSLIGYASQIVKANAPLINVEALSGVIQPSAAVEGLAKAIRATDYYDLDIDHCDAPTYVSHNAMTTSFTQYVRGDKNGQDDYDTFPGMLSFSKSYNVSRDGAGLRSGSGKLSTILNNAPNSVRDYIKPSITDKTPQSTTFSFWVDEPTMTQPGTIHYKCTSTIMTPQDDNVLKYGTPDTNVLAIAGSYDGVAYNMSNIKDFSTLGFSLDDTGTAITNPQTVTNSWSSSIHNVFQTANIINDINALATQFSGDFTVTIPGTTKGYTICQPVSLIIMLGNTISPASGIYNIKSISHNVSSTFITTMKMQRMAISSATQVAIGMGIVTPEASQNAKYNTTPNVKSPGKVEFGPTYPTWIDMQNMA